MRIIKINYLIILSLIFLSGCSNSKVEQKKLGYKVNNQEVIYVDYYITSSYRGQNPNGPIGLGAFIPSFDFLKFSDGKVKYVTRILENLDIKTFQILKDGYAKDKDSVYYKGKKLFYINHDESIHKKVSPDNFTPLGYGYAKNDIHVFFEGIQRNYWDSKSFKIIDSDCIMDNKNIKIKRLWGEYYYLKYKDQKFDYETFERVYDKTGTYPSRTNFFKDKNNVYYEGEILSNVDSSSFEVMYDNFIKDSFHIYSRINMNHNTKFEIVTNDVSGFKPYYIKFEDSNLRLRSNYYMDSNNVYYIDSHNIEKLNIAPEKFELLKYSYAKSEKNIFYKRRIVNCDYKTFTFRKESSLNPGDAEDKNNYYKNGKIIQKK